MARKKVIKCGSLLYTKVVYFPDFFVSGDACSFMVGKGSWKNRTSFFRTFLVLRYLTTKEVNELEDDRVPPSADSHYLLTDKGILFGLTSQMNSPDVFKVIC